MQIKNKTFRFGLFFFLSFFMLITCFASAKVWAATLVVRDVDVLDYGDPQCDDPDNYTFIQTAIDAAVSGTDDVLVCAGTYVENIDFSGTTPGIIKAIIVHSKRGAGNTIIDGNANRSVVIFNSGENNNSVLDGFTIIHGTGELREGHTHGGGIFCSDSSPTIINCVVKENQAHVGGGILSTGGSSFITIINCIIKENMTIDTGSNENHTYRALGSSINVSNALNKGGGIACVFDAQASISGSVIEKNVSQYGGGIFCGNTSTNITDCVISENIADSDGGGIYYIGFAPGNITNCIVSGNTAGINGGGIYYQGSNSTVTNCTITANTANMGGGFSAYGSSIVYLNSILWGNIPFQNGVFGSTFNIDYSTIEGGYEGTGNISSNPMFVAAANGDYHLQPGSPCIDSATSTHATITIPSEDIEGDSRGFDGNGIPDNPVTGDYDMGADEYKHSVRISQLFTRNSTTNNWEMMFSPNEAIKVNDGIIIGGLADEGYKVVIRYFFIDSEGTKTFLDKKVLSDRLPGTYLISKEVVLPDDAASGVGKIRSIAIISQDGTQIDRVVKERLINIGDEYFIEIPSVKIGQLFTRNLAGRWDMTFYPDETLKVKDGIIIEAPQGEEYKLLIRYFFIDSEGTRTSLGKKIFLGRSPGTYRTSKEVTLPDGAASGIGRMRTVVIISQDGTQIDRDVKEGLVNIEERN